MIRVPFGHGESTGANGTPDVDLAVGHGIADTIGGITEYGDFRSNIQVSDIIGCGTVTGDGGSRHSHTAKALTCGT